MPEVSARRGGFSSNTRGMAAGPHRRPSLQIACYDPVRAVDPRVWTSSKELHPYQGTRRCDTASLLRSPLTDGTVAGSLPNVTGPSAERNANVKRERRDQEEGRLAAPLSLRYSSGPASGSSGSSPGSAGSSA